MNDTQLALIGEDRPTITMDTVVIPYPLIQDLRRYIARDEAITDIYRAGGFELRNAGRYYASGRHYTLEFVEHFLLQASKDAVHQRDVNQRILRTRRPKGTVGGWIAEQMLERGCLVEVRDFLRAWREDWLDVDVTVTVLEEIVAELGWCNEWWNAYFDLENKFGFPHIHRADESDRMLNPVTEIWTLSCRFCAEWMED